MHASIQPEEKTMKTMKATAALLSFALLSSAAGAALADVHVYVNCDDPGTKCPTPPKPPRPPIPPAPPAPPAPDIAMAASPADVAIPAPPPAPPAPAAPPAPPAPPPPPNLPPVPDSAHADCASKNPGTRLSFTLRPGETMSGICQKVHGRMRFSLREYRLNE
jgi:hypothetical protein